MRTYCSEGEGSQVKINDLEKRKREQNEESTARRARCSGEEEGQKERIDLNLDLKWANDN